ncbi:ribonuclease III [Lachnospiraceae bacterium NSJ-143]|nr:ribonuclease III [Lachnospiraceae bacterium NSJ-143]
MDKHLTEFENLIGYKFNDKDILSLALTHSSYANEHKLGRFEYNERLEFLGDAVLEFFVSRYIYEKYPELPEGELTKLRAGVVCEGSLAKKALEIQLGDFLFLGKGEELTGGRKRESILADAFEAVIGAVIIDGGIDSAEKYVMGLMKNVIDSVRNSFMLMDYKTRLQEEIQKFSKEPVSYVITKETGPDHGKLFESEVSHCSNILGSGLGKSKKEAEQNAAKDALSKMKK